MLASILDTVEGRTPDPATPLLVDRLLAIYCASFDCFNPGGHEQVPS